MNRAVFRDLQGTLGGEAAGNIEEFVPSLCVCTGGAAQAGFYNIIITNQSSIGKGFCRKRCTAGRGNAFCACLVRAGG